MGTVNCRLECEGIGLIRSPGTRGVTKCPELRCPLNNYGIAGKKVLSITMPWAWLILKHGKDIENRTWFTNYRGEILIHASKKPEPDYLDILRIVYHPRELDEKTKEKWRYLNAALCGCIIGSVELIDCVKYHDSTWAENGFWNWVLRNPKIFKKPIPARGSLGLWQYKEYGKK